MEHLALWERADEALSPALSDLMKKTQAALALEAQARPYQPVRVEEEAEALVRRIAPLVVEHLVRRAHEGRVRNEHVCPLCGGPLRFVQVAPRTLGFAFGQVRIKRARYHCRRCHKGRTPLEQVWGLQSGPLAMGKRRLTPRAQEQLVTLSASLAYQKARDHFQRLAKLAVSTMTAWRYTQRLGKLKREGGGMAVSAIPFRGGSTAG